MHFNFFLKCKMNPGRDFVFIKTSREKITLISNIVELKIYDHENAIF
jgi:hypothetical protein